MPTRPTRRRAATLVLVAIPALVFACVDPPPKIASIPPSGLAVRLHVFGAQASDARSAFQSIRTNNRTFSLVNDGGDGELLVGLENDSPKCVAPTALCSFKVSFRVRDRRGEVVHVSTETISATSDKCDQLCSKALVNVATKVVETAAPLLVAAGAGGGEGGAGEIVEGGAAAAAEGTAVDAGVSSTAADAEAPKSASSSGASAAAASPKKKTAPKEAAAQPAKPEPVICAVGHGPRLPSDEAERRAAQVEALKRMSVLDQNEYDCLRKAYLDRL